LDRERVFENEDPAPFLEHVDGIWCGGFGQRGAEGKSAPLSSRANAMCLFRYLLCMQMAVIERREICAASTTRIRRIRRHQRARRRLMTEWMKGNELHKRGIGSELGGTMRLGAYPPSCSAAVGSPKSIMRRKSPSAIAIATKSTPLQGPSRPARHAFFRHVARWSVAGIIEFDDHPCSSACSFIPS